MSPRAGSRWRATLHSLTVLKGEMEHKPLYTTDYFLTQRLGTSSMAGRADSLATSALVSIEGEGKEEGGLGERRWKV